MELQQDTTAALREYVPTYSYELSFTSTEELNIADIIIKFQENFPNLKLRRISNW